MYAIESLHVNVARARTRRGAFGGAYIVERSRKPAAAGQPQPIILAAGIAAEPVDSEHGTGIATCEIAPKPVTGCSGNVQPRREREHECVCPSKKNAKAATRAARSAHPVIRWVGWIKRTIHG